MGVDDKITKTVEAVESFVKAVPVYNDAIQPAAKQIGKSLKHLLKQLRLHYYL
jgi:hypothetical protein